MNTNPARPVALRYRPPQLGSLPAFVELGKLKIFELWLGVALAWSMLGPDYAWSSSTFALLGCALLIEVGTTSAALALDDLTGFRDGVDADNHADTDRYGIDKPLLTGRLTERQALIFGTGPRSLPSPGC